jgi:hypothetical protein
MPDAVLFSKWKIADTAKAPPPCTDLIMPKRPYINVSNRNNARRGAFFQCVEGARSRGPTGWIGVMPLAVQRVGIDLPRSAARLGRDAPRLMDRPHEAAECDGSEQRRFRAAGW